MGVIIPILLVLIAVVFSPAVLYSIEVWMDDGTYSHGLLSLLIIIYVLIKSKASAFYLRDKPSLMWLVSFLACVFIGKLSDIYLVELVHRSIFILALLCFAFTIFEDKCHKYFIVPMFILALASPIWGLSIPILQYIAVLIVGFGTELSGIEVLLQDIYITIPVGTFKVANGCSGLRYFLVALTVVVLFSFKFLKERQSWIKLAALAIALSFITNWIRIGYLVYIGHVSNMLDPMIEDHNTLGWIIFMVPIFLIYKYGYKLLDSEIAENRSIKAQNSKEICS